MNKNSLIALPEWLDARTVAMFSAFIALGAMMQTSHVGLRNDMNAMEQRLSANIDTVRDEVDKVRDEVGEVRTEFRADIDKLADRLRKVEIDVAAIRVGIVGFDARLRAVEEPAQHRGRGTVPQRDH